MKLIGIGTFDEHVMIPACMRRAVKIAKRNVESPICYITRGEDLRNFLIEKAHIDLTLASFEPKHNLSRLHKNG